MSRNFVRVGWEITMRIILTLTLFVAAARAHCLPVTTENFTVIYEWNLLDYEFRSEADRLFWINSGLFIPENNEISNLRRHDDRIFVVAHRSRPGIPATLLELPYDKSLSKVSGTKLKPYPSWAWNDLGNCTAIQNAHAIEVDQYDRLWVVDLGQVYEDTEFPDYRCHPKLILIDLKTNSVIHSYRFPAAVVDRLSGTINEIVVGCTSKISCWAYFTDDRDEKIIGYNLDLDRAWFVHHTGSMKTDVHATKITIDGKVYELDVPLNGVALSPLDTGFSSLYYSPLSSYHLYKLDTRLIRKLMEASNYGIFLDSSDVTDLGVKPSQSDASMMDANGILYYGQLSLNAVYKWDTAKGVLSERNQIPVIQDDKDLQWQSSIAVDESGDGFVTTSRYQRLLYGTYSRKEINFRIIRFHVGAKSYQFPREIHGVS